MRATIGRPDMCAKIGRNLSLASMGGLATLGIIMERPELKPLGGRDGAVLRLEDCLPELQQFHGVRDVAAALATTPRLLGATALNTAVHVPKFASYLDYAETSGADLILDANSHGWSWPTGIIDLPLLFKDADVHFVSLKALEEEIVKHKSDVVLALDSILVWGQFCDDIESAAQQLNFSTRTLQGHFQAEGMSVREISEEAKCRSYEGCSLWGEVKSRDCETSERSARCPIERP